MSNKAEQDWVEAALKSASPIVLEPHESALATLLVERAYEVSTKKDVSLGLTLAACYDMLVSAQYYGAVGQSGWLHCSVEEPLLIYPFTNTCPRCVLSTSFVFHNSNKPESGSIGNTTSRLLAVLLDRLIARNGRGLKIYRGTEPVDVIFYDEANRVALLAEIKAAPLTTLPLAAKASMGAGHQPKAHNHIEMEELFALLPQAGSPSYRLLNIGKRADVSKKAWAFHQFERLLRDDDALFADYFRFWLRAYHAYNKTERKTDAPIDPVFWMTNGCGQPSPRPSDWPKTTKRKADGSVTEGTSYESISDSKSSVGMDRTDDIKKGIYQVLNIGAESKRQGGKYIVKTALISNLHAIRHHEGYLESLQDIVWARDPTDNLKGVVRTASHLPADTEVYNLFDGIISFSKNHSRDKWIDDNFNF